MYTEALQFAWCSLTRQSILSVCCSLRSACTEKINDKRFSGKFCWCWFRRFVIVCSLRVVWYVFLSSSFLSWLYCSLCSSVIAAKSSAVPTYGRSDKTSTSNHDSRSRFWAISKRQIQCTNSFWARYVRTIIWRNRQRNTWLILLTK